jgi:hypothetical protein
MDYVRETHDVGHVALSLAGNLSSQMDETDIIMRMDDIIENEFGLIPNQEEEINIIDETFEEFATYLLQNCQHE